MEVLSIPETFFNDDSAANLRQQSVSVGETSPVLFHSEVNESGKVVPPNNSQEKT